MEEEVEDKIFFKNTETFVANDQVLLFDEWIKEYGRSYPVGRWVKEFKKTLP